MVSSLLPAAGAAAVPAPVPSSATAPAAVPVSAAQANEAIRQYVLGRRSWSRSELAELDRLRGVWREAAARPAPGPEHRRSGGRAAERAAASCEPRAAAAACRAPEPDQADRCRLPLRPAFAAAAVR